MNILIVGCGKVGSTLAEQLANEGHDITVIDTNEEAVRRVTSQCDVMGVVGNGVVHRVQKDAGIEYADMFIAMTGSDELNLLCCLIAKKATTTCRTIARVRNPDFISERGFIKEKLGINMLINPELEAANEIARLFSIPSAIEVDTFARGRIDLMTTILPANSPLAGQPIRHALGKLSGKVLICAIERGQDVIIPTGDDQLLPGDKISFVASRKEAGHFFKKAGFTKEHIKSIMIVGGGKISYYLARRLSDVGYRVKIIEKDKEHCEMLNQLLPDNVVIIHGDGSDQSLLLEEGIKSADGFASITDIDEENVMLSLYVKSNFKAKTVTKINKMNFEGIIDRLALGSVIYPKFITAEMILSYVRALENTTGSNVQTLYNIVGGKAQALEFNIRSESDAIGVELMNLHLKKNVLLCCISRHGKILIPGGRDSVQIGDTVVIVTTNKGMNDFKDILA